MDAVETLPMHTNEIEAIVEEHAAITAQEVALLSEVEPPFLTTPTLLDEEADALEFLEETGVLEKSHSEVTLRYGELPPTPKKEPEVNGVKDTCEVRAGTEVEGVQPVPQVATSDPSEAVEEPAANGPAVEQVAPSDRSGVAPSNSSGDAEEPAANGPAVEQVAPSDRSGDAEAPAANGPAVEQVAPSDRSGDAEEPAANGPAVEDEEDAEALPLASIVGAGPDARPEEELKGLEPIRPAEQRPRKPRGRGKGRGRGRGRGKKAAEEESEEDTGGASASTGNPKAKLKNHTQKSAKVKSNKAIDTDPSGHEAPGKKNKRAKHASTSEVPAKRSRRKSQASDKKTPEKKAPSETKGPGSRKGRRVSVSETEGSERKRLKASPGDASSSSKPDGGKRTSKRMPAKNAAVPEATTSEAPARKEKDASMEANEGATDENPKELSEKEIRKKAQSRKSSAYHAAKKKALKDGRTMEAAIEIAKRAAWFANKLA